MKKKADPKPLLTLSNNVIESYIFSTSRQDLSIYSERLLLCLVKVAQCMVYGLDFKNVSGVSNVNIDELNTTVDISISKILGSEDSNNYTYAKKAVKGLISAHHEHEVPVLDRSGKPVYDKFGKQMFQYEAHTLVNDVYVNRKPGIITVEVNRNTWAAMLDFSKGYRRYDLLVALRFSLVHSLRMYKLISNQQYPLTYTIEDLRYMWGVGEKYRRPNDIVKCINLAKAELDECSPWTFTYERNYAATGRRGQRPLVSVTFYPVHQLRFESSSDLGSKLDPVSMFGREVVDRLVKDFNFSMDSVRNNSVLFMGCKKLFGTVPGKPSFEDFLVRIAPNANRAVNSPGYVVNALKIHLEENYGYVFKAGELVKVDG